MIGIGLVATATVGLWLAAALVLDRHGRRGVSGGTFDAIVVLGCRVLDDGTPSGHLQRRVESAVTLWRQGLAPTVVVSGGGDPSEASVGARHARALGLPASVLVVEDRSRRTVENARRCAEIIDAERVLVVTDSYHVLRARSAFRRWFPEVEAVGVIAPLSVRVENAMREVLALAWDLATRWRQVGRA